ncbi:hypothetical protein J4P41_11985, partial [Gluconobacter sp. NFX36]
AMDRDLLKTQSESHPGNPQSKRQKTKIIRQAHQQTVLRSLHLEDKAGLTLAVFAPLSPVPEASQITVLDVNSENIKGSLNGL